MDTTNNNNNDDMQNNVSVEEILAFNETQGKEPSVDLSSNLQKSGERLSEDEAKEMIEIIKMSGEVKGEESLMKKLMSIPFDKVGKTLLRKFYTDVMSKKSSISDSNIEEYEDFKSFLLENKTDVGKVKSLINAFLNSKPEDFKYALYNSMPDFADKLFKQEQRNGNMKTVEMDYDTIKTLGRDFLGIDKDENEDDFQYSERVKNMFDKFASVMASKFPQNSMDEDSLVGKLANAIEDRVIKKVMEGESNKYKKMEENNRYMSYTTPKGGDDYNYNNDMQKGTNDPESIIIMALQVDKNLNDKEVNLIRELIKKDQRYLSAHNLANIDGGESLEKVIMSAYDKYDMYRKGQKSTTFSPKSTQRQLPSTRSIDFQASQNGNTITLLDRLRSMRE